MTEKSELLKRLDSMRTTASARFHMARRYQRRELLSLYSIAGSSLGIVLIGLLNYFGVQLRVDKAVVDLSVIVLSLAVLVLSLIENGGGFGKRAERAHSGALAVNAIASKYRRALESDDTQACDRLYEEYVSVLAAHENHDPIDYRFALIDRPADPKKVGWWQKRWNWLEIQFRYLLYLLPLLGLLVFAVIILDGACIACRSR